MDQIRCLNIFVNCSISVELEELEDIVHSVIIFLNYVCWKMKDFTVDTEMLEWNPAAVRINTDLFGRIMNNIISNIEKYGRNNPIQVQILYEENYTGILIRNTVVYSKQTTTIKTGIVMVFSYDGLEPSF